MIYNKKPEFAQQIEAWALERYNSHKPKHDRHIDLEVHEFQIWCKYAVWDTVGGTWRRHNNNGIDVIVRGFGLQVNANTYHDGEFYVHGGQEFVADVGVLVIPHGQDALNIVAAIGRYHFNSVAREEDQDGKGQPTKSVARTDMMNERQTDEFLLWLREFGKDEPRRITVD